MLSRAARTQTRTEAMHARAQAHALVPLVRNPVPRERKRKPVRRRLCRSKMLISRLDDCARPSIFRSDPVTLPIVPLIVRARLVICTSRPTTARDVPLISEAGLLSLPALPTTLPPAPTTARALPMTVAARPSTVHIDLVICISSPTTARGLPTTITARPLTHHRSPAIAISPPGTARLLPRMATGCRLTIHLFPATCMSRSMTATGSPLMVTLRPLISHTHPAILSSRSATARPAAHVDSRSGSKGTPVQRQVSRCRSQYSRGRSTHHRDPLTSLLYRSPFTTNRRSRRFRRRPPQRDRSPKQFRPTGHRRRRALLHRSR